MGEAIIITTIEVIVQEDQNRTLLQIDFEYSESKIKGRIFIDSREFFRLLSHDNSKA